MESETVVSSELDVVLEVDWLLEVESEALVSLELDVVLEVD